MADLFNHEALPEYFKMSREYLSEYTCSSTSGNQDLGLKSLKNLYQLQKKIDFTRDDYKMWVFPVYSNNHWTTCYVDFKNTEIGYIDRLNELSNSSGPIDCIEKAWTVGLASFLQKMFEDHDNNAYKFTEWDMKIIGRSDFSSQEQQNDSNNCGIISIMQSFMLGRYGKLDKFGDYGGHNEFREARKQLGGYLFKRCSNKTDLLRAVNS